MLFEFDDDFEEDIDINKEDRDDSKESSNRDEAEVVYRKEISKIAIINNVIAVEDKSRDFNNNKEKY
jgi:hypothetical protein